MSSMEFGAVNPLRLIDGDYGAVSASESTAARIRELGLEKAMGQPFFFPEEIRKVYEEAIWRLASEVKSRRFRYKKVDYRAALNFIEMFCFYSTQANATSRTNERALEAPDYDKTVQKAVAEAEKIYRLMDGDKVVLKAHVKRLIHLVDKIFTGHLTLTEQVALGKTVAKAEKILKKLL